VSDVERLDIKMSHWNDRLGLAWMQVRPNGDYVRYKDYARLKVEVERLSKAGDAMAKLLSCCGNPQSEVRGWHAAKGVQS